MAIFKNESFFIYQTMWLGITHLGEKVLCYSRTGHLIKTRSLSNIRFPENFNHLQVEILNCGQNELKAEMKKLLPEILESIHL